MEGTSVKDSKSLVYQENMNSITKLKHNTFIYEWQIEEFGNFLQRKYEIPSPIFSTHSGSATDWKLILFVRHKYPIGPYIVASLVKMSDDNKPIGVQYTITIISLKNKKVGVLKEKTFRHCMDFDEYEVVSHFDLIKNNLLLNNTLTILCEMNILYVESSDDNIKCEFPFSSQKIGTYPFEKCNQELNANNLLFNKNKVFNKCSNSYNILNEDADEFTDSTKGQLPFNDEDSINILLNDFESLYKSNTFSDVTLVCDDVPMAAHKIILAARSDYFKQLCLEKGNISKINISNVSSTAMEAVLYYLYTGKMRPLTVEFALEIYSASRKFHLCKLQVLIFDFLKSNLTVNNVTEVLQACEDLNLSELKSACLKFVNSNHSEVVQSEKWNCLIKNNPHIAGEVLLTIASFQKMNIL